MSVASYHYDEEVFWWWQKKGIFGHDEAQQVLHLPDKHRLYEVD